MFKNIRSDFSPDKVFKLFQGIIKRFNASSDNVLLNSGALAIKTASSAIVKTASAVYAMVNDVLVTKAASDMAALVGTVINATFNVFVFHMTSGGVLATSMGTAGATLGAVKMPAIPLDSVVLGMVVVNPTGTGNFVGGTTALDDVTVVPNAAYINTVGAFKPTGSVGTLNQLSTE